MIFIYSGEVPALDQALLKKLGDKHTLTIIPASMNDMASAKQHKLYFRHQGIRARLQPLRYYQDRKRLPVIFQHSDAVYLAGGNTFEFLAYAQRVGLFALLAEFEQRGGIIVAESAGSILLSPTIATASIPSTCPDDERVKLEDYRGMARLPFHISPHYEPDAATAKQERRELKALALHSGHKVLLLQDGEGVVIKGNKVVLEVGEPKWIKAPKAVHESIDVDSLLLSWMKD